MGNRYLNPGVGSSGRVALIGHQCNGICTVSLRSTNLLLNDEYNFLVYELFFDHELLRLDKSTLDFD